MARASVLRGIAAPLLASVAACSGWTKVGIVSVKAPGAHEAVVTLDATREINFGADLAMTYSNDVDARYVVDLLQNGVVVAHAECDPFAVHVCSTRIRWFGSYDIRCRMECPVRVPASGPTLVRAWFVTSEGGGVAIDHANLVLEQ